MGDLAGEFGEVVLMSSEPCVLLLTKHQRHPSQGVTSTLAKFKRSGDPLVLETVRRTG